MRGLTVDRLEGGYGDTIVLRGVSLTLRPGQLTALVGANGAGKTTLLRAIMGVVRPRAGRVLFDGHDLTHAPAHGRARRGLALVPEGRQLFSDMSVAENLELGALGAGRMEVFAENRARVLRLFPRLAERLGQRAGTLSGGEQQMVAIARGLMGSPSVLMFDELSLGLSPAVTLGLFKTLQDLRDGGQTMLLVEQNIRLALVISDYVYVLAEGAVRMEGTPDALADREDVRAAFLGLS